jgi:predicted CXXCH cytochrome family protein
MAYRVAPRLLTREGANRRSKRLAGGEIVCVERMVREARRNLGDLKRPPHSEEAVMRNFLKALLAVALVTPTFAFAAGNILNSKHNLSTSQVAPNVRSTNWDEVCIFCHTPHNPAGATRLLWNRSSTTTAGWQGTNSTSAGTRLPNTGGIQNVSAMCLSCHDGAQAIGAVINQSNRSPGPAAFTGTNVNPVTGMINGTVTNLGTNLQGSHPVSVPYPTAGKTGYGAIAASGADINTYNVATSTCVGSARCTTGGAAGARIPLYQDSSGRDGVECGSCHSAHDNTQVSFLRVSNAGSALCLGCHLK